MKINSLILITILGLITTSAYGEDYKIGAVNALKVLEQSPQAERARSVIEKEFAPRDKQLVAMQKDIKAQEDKLAKDGAIMSDSERSTMERDLINKKRDLKREQDEFRDDFNFRRNEEFSKIQKEIVQAIQTVAKDNNFDIVLSDGVMYMSSKIDITDKVIEYLKKQSN